MRPAAALGLAVAIGGGMFAALRLDHYLEGRLTADTLARLADASPARDVALDGAMTMDFRTAAKKVDPSVVAVDKYQQVRRGYFNPEVATVETGTGSGVILGKDGTIVTNNHVVEAASEVRVRLSDKRTFIARVVGRDPLADLAVLKIDASGLIPVDIGSSAGLQVGQWVLAVGNPLGFDNTVSVGVVSSIARQLPTERGGLVDAIQTDAAINPGNSGGALCDVEGRLVGINTAIASSTGQSVGIGFAIPVDRVKTVAADLVKLGYVRYARLPITPIANSDHALSDPEARAYVSERVGGGDVPDYGLIIADGGGSAVKQLDILLAVEGLRVDARTDLWRALTKRKPGESAKVRVWRAGQVLDLEVPLGEMRSGGR